MSTTDKYCTQVDKPVHGRDVETKNILKAICLKPLNKYYNNKVLDDFRANVGRVQAQFEVIVDQGNTWH
jgi:hypothetical protein